MARHTDEAGAIAELGSVLCLPDLEEQARACMTPMAYEFVASGAADEHTIRWNVEAFARLMLNPRVPDDAAAVDMSVSLFGRVLPFPILLAPTAYHKAIHPEGEIATARGAGAAQATLVVSSASNTAIEDIAAAAAAPLWFQLYFQSDKEFTRELVWRAEGAGCEALCLTVDTPVIGARNRQKRAEFKLPPGVTIPHRSPAQAAAPIMKSERVAVTWTDIEWLASFVRVPLLLKGILNADDAERGIHAGAAGIIVSNHGGRNLDTVPATIDALPAVVDRVAGRVPVLVDGGIRRGTDVVKAIATGAAAVLIGRPYCYGLALAGSAGVQRTVEILREELELAMMLLGRPVLRKIDRSALWS